MTARQIPSNLGTSEMFSRSKIFLVSATAAVLGTAQAVDESVLEEAELARKENRPKDALPLYRKFIEAHPDHLEAHIGVQRLQLEHGNPHKMRDEYKDVLNKHPRAPFHLLYGRLLLDAVREEGLYREGLLIDSKDADLQHALAFALVRQLRYKEALKPAEAAIRLDPERLKSHRLRIEILDFLHDDGRGVDLYAKLTAENPDSMTLAQAHTYALAYAGRLKEALAECSRVIEMAPESADALVTRAVIHLRSNEGDAGKADVEAALKIDPWHPRGQAVLGQIKVLLDRDESGIDHLMTSLRLTPDRSAPYESLGQCLLTLNRFAEARLRLKTALELDPSRPLPYHNLALFAAQEKRYDDALKLAKQAIERDPRDPDAHQLAAQILTRMKRPEEAAKAIATAAKLRESKPRADASFSVRIGGKEHAEIVSPNETESETLVLLSESLTRKGKLDEAITRLREAVGADAESIAAHGRLSIVLARKGDLPGALENRKKCIQLLKAKGATPELIDRHARDVRRIEHEIKAAKAELPGRLRLDGIRMRSSTKPDYCMPMSLATVLRHWDIESSAEKIGVEMKTGSNGTSVRNATDWLELQKKHFSYTWFLGTESKLKELLRAGAPAIVLFWKFNGLDDYEGHASVVVGFDDTLGEFLLEDSNWRSNATGREYAGLEQTWALLIAPQDRFDDLSELVGDDSAHFEPVLEAERLVADGKHPEALSHYAKGLEHGQAYNAALVACTAAVAAGKRDPTRMSEMLATARALVEPSLPIAVAAGDSRPYIVLGSAVWDAGNRKAAIEQFRKAIEIEPRHAGNRELLARMLWETEDVDGSRSQFDEIIRQHPEFAAAYAGRGTLHAATGKFEEAEKDLAQSVLFGAGPEQYLNLARVRARLRKFDEAIRTLASLRSETNDEDTIKQIHKVEQLIHQIARSPESE